MFWHFWFLRRHPFLKNIINICCWIFAGFGLYLLLIADERFQAYPKFQAGIAFLSLVTMIVPYTIFHTTHLHKRYERGLLIHLEALIILPLSLNGIGARWLYDLGIGFDSFVHFLNTLFLTLLTGTVAWMVTHGSIARHRPLVFLSLATSFVVFGVLFEAYEQFSDAWFQTSMWGENGQNIVMDTRDDIFYDALGAIGGAAYFVYDGIPLLSRWKKQQNAEEVVSLS